MTEKHLKIVQLTAENIKRLQAVTITPEGSVEIIGGDNAQGKQQPISEPVLTPNGWFPIGDIHVDDLVIGSSGAPIKVLGVFPQAERQTFIVRFKDGGWTRCGPEHLWAVSSWEHLNRTNQRIPTTLTTLELLDRGLWRGPARRFAVSSGGAVQFADSGEELPIEPYTLGVILGDGHIETTGYVTVTSWDEEIFSALDVNRAGYRSKHELGTGTWSRPLRHLGLAGLRSYEKFVPQVYLHAGIRDRQAILAGLLDTDGTAPQTWAQFATTSAQLAKDVQYLARSLGYICSDRETQKSYRYNGELKRGRPAWNLLIKSPASPFRLTRKSEKWIPSARQPSIWRLITSIEEDEPEDSVCIKVDAEDGLYVTRDFILTHNTSLLDSIEMALNGGKSIPPNPIRRGQKKARVVVDLGELKVERRFTNKGSVLEVTAANGLKQNSPQAILDELTGKLTFDPLAFIQMKPVDQLKTLKDLVGINFDDLEVKRQNLYAERTELNRDVKNLEGQLEGIPEHENAPAVIVISDLMAQLDSAETHNRAAAASAQQVESLDAQIATLREEAERLLARMNAIKAEVETKLAERDWIDIPTLMDTAKLKEKIASAETINQKAREVEERARVEKLLKAKRSESTKLTLTIENIDGEKESRLAEVKFPVPNLSFGENGVLLNGLPLEQASAAESLKVSVAMGFALNPRLKVLLIRDGSLLDEHSLKTVAEMAEEHDGQVWIERVSKGAECSVIIENGMIAEKEDGWE